MVALLKLLITASREWRKLARMSAAISVFTPFSSSQSTPRNSIFACAFADLRDVSITADTLTALLCSSHPWREKCERATTSTSASVVSHAPLRTAIFPRFQRTDFGPGPLGLEGGWRKKGARGPAICGAPPASMPERSARRAPAQFYGSLEPLVCLESSDKCVPV